MAGGILRTAGTFLAVGGALLLAIGLAAAAWGMHHLHEAIAKETDLGGYADAYFEMIAWGFGGAAIGFPAVVVGAALGVAGRARLHAARLRAISPAISRTGGQAGVPSEGEGPSGPTPRDDGGTPA